MQVLKASIVGPLDRVKDRPVKEKIDIAAQAGAAAVLYVLALTVLYKFGNKFVPLLLVIVGAVAGQFVFIE
jgi:hypothetical protein